MSGLSKTVMMLMVFVICSCSTVNINSPTSTLEPTYTVISTLTPFPTKIPTQTPDAIATGKAIAAATATEAAEKTQAVIKTTQIFQATENAKLEALPGEVVDEKQKSIIFDSLNKNNTIIRYLDPSNKNRVLTLKANNSIVTELDDGIFTFFLIDENQGFIEIAYTTPEGAVWVITDRSTSTRYGLPFEIHVQMGPYDKKINQGAAVTRQTLAYLSTPDNYCLRLWEAEWWDWKTFTPAITPRKAREEMEKQIKEGYMPDLLDADTGAQTMENMMVFALHVLNPDFSWEQIIEKLESSEDWLVTTNIGEWDPKNKGAVLKLREADDLSDIQTNSRTVIVDGAFTIYHTDLVPPFVKKGKEYLFSKERATNLLTNYLDYSFWILIGVKSLGPNNMVFYGLQEEANMLEVINLIALDHTNEAASALCSIY